MRVLPTSLPGVLIVEPRVLRDARGFFLETFHAERYAEHGIEGPFVQDNHSRSVRHTLRGLHWQTYQPQGKLIRVIEGEVFDVAVDVRPHSPSRGQWVSVVLSADDFRQVYVPPGFAHGFCVLSDVAQVEYKCTTAYHRESERGIIWNDPELAIAWPVATPILSDRDRLHGSFADWISEHTV